MKKILLCLSVMSVMSLRAQYTITSAAAPAVGDVMNTVEINTVGISMPTTGTSKFWNYTSVTLNTLSTSSSTFVSASSVPNASLFPGATIAETYDGVDFSMYQNTTTNWIYKGNAAATPSDCGVFSDPMTVMTIPFTYNSTFTDAFAFSDQTFTYTGTSSMLGSGTGTLALPGNTLTNVLMVTQSYTQNINYSGGAVSVKGNSYTFFSALSKASLFSITTSTQTQGTSTTVAVSGNINKNYLVVGVNEKQSANDFSIYPNPSSDDFTFLKINSAAKVEMGITDIFGRTIKEETFNNLTTGENILKFNTSDFPVGVYFINIRSGNTERVQKLIID